MKATAIKINRQGALAVWFSALWLAVVLIFTATAHGDIYSWQDHEGVIHFSNQKAPPESSLYMREPVAAPEPSTDNVNRQPHREPVDVERIKRQAQTEARLEEANRKLDRALERVDELTETVSKSRAEAAAAAEAAQQAAVTAQYEAESARSYQEKDKSESIVVYTAPHRHRHKKRGIRHHRPGYYNPDTKAYGYYNWSGRSKSDRKKVKRQHRVYHRKPVPILPPERHRIPKAYGIR